MCGRFSLGLPHGRVIHAVRIAHPDLDLDDDWVDEDAFHPRYNIAPRSRSPVLRRRNRHDDGDVSESCSGAFLQTMKWGLIPHWSKHEDNTLNTINAKAENLVEGGGMWNSIKGRKRCAVLCQGYYEWLKKGKGRLPHYTKHRDGKLMFLAGLYDSVTLEGSSEPLWTFTIVTTDANKQLSWLHDRQPVILSTKAELDAWLDTSSESWSPNLAPILRPYNDANAPLECYAVPTDVGKVGTDSSTFIEPIAQRKDGIQAMFSKQKNKMEATPVSKCDDKSSGKSKAESSTGPSKRKHESTSSDGETSLGDKRQKTRNFKSPIENTTISLAEAKKDSEVLNGSSDVEVISPPSPSKASNVKPQSKAKSPKKSPRNTSSRDNSSSATITQFFSKTT